MKNIFLKDYHLKTALKKIFPESFRKVIIDILIAISTAKVVGMKEKTRLKLNIFFKDDVRKLSALLNRDLTNWIK